MPSIHFRVDSLRLGAPGLTCITSPPTGKIDFASSSAGFLPLVPYVDIFERYTRSYFPLLSDDKKLDTS